MLVVWVSLLVNASLPVHVGLWNGVNWMVALVFYLFNGGIRTHLHRLRGNLHSAKC